MGNRLYVGNLSFSATSDTIREAFGQAGEVTDIHIVTDRDSGKPRGFAFVTMGSQQAAADAVQKLNGQVLDGRPLRVREAEDRPQRSGGGGGGGGGFRDGPRRDGGGGRGRQGR
jgi:RNA recognition motif-containing protein